ncbi:sigma factor [Fulvitalea axinellae]
MNHSQFKSFFEENYSPLCLYAYRIVNDDGLAKDIVQDSFLKIWEKIEGSDIENPKGYLFRIVRNKALDETGAQHTTLDDSFIGPSVDSSEKSLIIDECYDILKELLSRVPFKSREIFEMSRSAGI